MTKRREKSKPQKPELVFAGVIIAGIMDENIDHRLLFLTGSLVVIVFALVGLIIMSNNKEDN